MDPKNEIIIKSQDFYDVVIQKIIFYEDVIKKTFLSLLEYKKEGIIGSNEINYSVNELNFIMDELRLLECHIKDHTMGIEEMVACLQVLNNRLSNIIKLYGTNSLEHLISICFGNDYFEKNITSENDKSKFEILTNYTHPLTYKVISDKESKDHNDKSESNPILEDIYCACNKDNLYCYTNRNDSSNHILKLNTLKIVIRDNEIKTSIIVTVLVDTMMIEYLLSNQYVYDLYYGVKDNIPSDEDINKDVFNIFYKSLTLSELLVNNRDEIFDLYRSYISSIKIFKNRPLSKIISEFIKCDLVGKRKTLIQLLLNDNDTEFQYMAYLLYDTISNDDKNRPDTYEQTMLFDSLPWNIKIKFKCAMKETIEYTHNLLSIDSVNKIPLEQRICLLKVNDSVKEKAMMKLKEIKSKSDDTTSKARQWLDGLLKIPFSIYRKEPIFDIVKINILNFKNFIKNNTILLDNKIDNTIDYSDIEIKKIANDMCKKMGVNINNGKIEVIEDKITKMKKMKFNEMVNFFKSMSDTIDESKLNECYNAKKIDNKKVLFKNIIKENLHTSFIYDLIQYLEILKGPELKLYQHISNINNTTYKVNKYMIDCKKTLDNSVYGHEDAKRQIERIVGQWINGKNSGYCLGFEGPPGVGKTSLAKKGLANCLKDENGDSRPFSFIAIGGTSNGSTLEGHNYTYVGSQWGKIVDILMDTKCMNPIIFIDEIDKVSRTESGKEIISILTHLIDQTQNDVIQDKYFSGVDLDLSKVLFVFSYNDVEVMDKILLDRIHRIKFDNLKLEEKLVICEKHILPELCERVGQIGNIFFSNDTLTKLIEEYTRESGVRKLKELIFEIIGEVNLEILSKNIDDIEYPINITIDDIKNKYLKRRNPITEKKIHKENLVGIINGLWANSLGMGGIIQIESCYIPTSGFLELKLTGQQGNVMKESMEVAKSLAWKLTEEDKKIELVAKFEKIKNGIHIHCPEGATPKDGPSAGTAITVCIYSLLNNKKINRELAITGEINMQGNVTAIGGLDLKILGGIKAGVKKFLFPKENEDDFKKFMEKYDSNPLIEDIEFNAITTIDQALSHSLIND